MKKTISFTIIILLSSFLFSQKHIGYDFIPYNNWVKTIKFNVLDINLENKVLAFKHIYQLQPQYISGGENGENEIHPIDCGYAGMESQPYAGVVLGIYDLKKGEYLKTFTIYESCNEISECYDHELSKQRLDSAKQIFSEYNLDYTKKEKPIVFTNKSKEKECSLNTGGINFSSTYENDYDNMLTVSYLYADNKLIWQTEHDDNFVMASAGEVKYKAAFKKENKIIFLIKYFHTHNMEGPKSYEYHYFSPIFSISDGKIIKE